jgi:hypothetical protein
MKEADFNVRPFFCVCHRRGFAAFRAVSLRLTVVNFYINCARLSLALNQKGLVPARQALPHGGRQAAKRREDFRELHNSARIPTDI